MNRARVTLVASVVSFAVLGVGLPASATPDTADRTARAIERVAPGVAVQGVSKGIDGSLTARGRVTVVSPATGKGQVQIGSLSLGLPAVATDAAAVAADGTVVYGGNGADLAVQALSDGARVQAVIGGKSAPTSYTYRLSDGIVPVAQADGSVKLTHQVADGIVVDVATVAAPWARDAHGKAVPTRYTIRGNSLVQVVDHRASGIAYPVVADPRVTVGWGVYIHYTNREARANSTGWRGTINDKAKYTAILCGYIGLNVAAGACAVLTYDVISSVMSTMKRAGATGHGFYYHCWFSGMPLGWGYEH